MRGSSFAAPVLAATLGGAALAPTSCNALTGASDVELVGPAGAPVGTAEGAQSAGGAHTGGTGTAAGAGGGGQPGGAGGSSADPCAGVACSGHGSCVPNASLEPECQCASGYHAIGLECIVDETCAGVTCSGRCRTCEVVGGEAECVCPDGFAPNGSDCTPSPDPCVGFSCNPGYTCIPEHHCQIDPLCVEICDCSNCGTCSMQDFTNAGLWVLYCGSGQSPPATVTCTDPCPSGSGCLPYSPGICWPGQGCMSAP